jgi:uncharacterized caspase-like protein
LLLSLLCTQAFAADRRVALVIGNAAYKYAPPLANAVADSVGLARLFHSADFEAVIARTDLGVVEFKRAVRDFLLTAEGADIAVVYYAGHGIEIGGKNYLVPTDAKLGHDYDVDDEAVSLDRIIWALQSVKRLRLIILDACRDNPFPARFRSVEVRAIAGGGLGQPFDIAADTLIAYAAKAGSQSFDGNGPNSPYATALMRHLAEPGLDIRIALGRVRDDVLAMTGGRQEPFIYGSLGGASITLVPATVALKSDAPPASGGTTEAAKTLPTVAPHAALPSAPPTTVQRAPQATLQTTPQTTPPPAPQTALQAAPQPAPQSARQPAPPNRLPDAASVCVRDEQRLEQLRADPVAEQVVAFARSLSCPGLRTQVQRLLESVGGSRPANAGSGGDERKRQQAEVAVAQSPEACANEAERLQRLRADPNPQEVRKLDSELSCERLRPQLLRLRESLGL